MSNLVISYDLNNPGQNYENVIKRIKELGSWAKIHKSVWFVKSTLTAKEASDTIWAVMDSNDTVFVVDSESNNAAWHNLSDEVSKFLITNWTQRSLNGQRRL